ncbi:unnamed protein product [Psylliodes chrysocephalus]|uniref:Uncharacterized protein n=1 Tax=Psylliodes chrysocephalus TaxID=3402493 RepID=A0A9P0CHX7_9CUCU|nr:unnamed protein product [Psylliodes chrysocephala]
MSKETLCKNYFENYRAEHLQDKIIREFGDVPTVRSSPICARKKLVYKHDIDVSKLVHSTVIRESAKEMKLREVAYSVRNSVKAINIRKLPEKLHVSNITDGECDIPVDLFNLIFNLIHGPDLRRQQSDDDLFRINSICSDIIYAITKGRIKPSKHLSLGLAIKSTSSRKVLTIINKYGHTVSYSMAEELETELAFTAQEEN